MKRFGMFQFIAVLAGALLAAGYASAADELIAPSRTLQGPVYPQGKLIVFSEPPGLPAALDGRSLGKTPTAVEAVNAGVHSLQVENKETEIIIAPDQTLAISLFKGAFVKVEKPEKLPSPAPEKAAPPGAEATRTPEASGEHRPPPMSPILHYRMFGYY